MTLTTGLHCWHFPPKAVADFAAGDVPGIEQHLNALTDLRQLVFLALRVDTCNRSVAHTPIAERSDSEFAVAPRSDAPSKYFSFSGSGLLKSAGGSALKVDSSGDQ